jgi:hypothetical protein
LVTGSTGGRVWGSEGPKSRSQPAWGYRARLNKKGE